jgi:hypothetical protein
MARILELAIVCVALLVALVAIRVGTLYVPELVRAVSAALGDGPWRAGELGRLVASALGPMLVGGLVCLGLLAYLVSAHRLRRAMAASPDQPWRWRSDWAAGRIRLSNRAPVAALVIATVLYAFVVVPLGIHLASLKNAGAVYAFLGVLAAFLGLFAGQQWVNRRRNCAELELQTLPGRIGGQFAAIATIPEAFDPGTGVRVTLRCVLTQSTAVGSGNTDDAVSVLTDTRNARRRSDSSTSTVFEDARLATVEDRGGSPRDARIRVVFDIPPELPATGVVFSGGGSDGSSRVTRHYRWSLRIRRTDESELREIAFEVPVFGSGPLG